VLFSDNNEEQNGCNLVKSFAENVNMELLRGQYSGAKFDLEVGMDNHIRVSQSSGYVDIVDGRI